ncbi:MAG: hypothetical protein ABJI96_03015 [Paracoccaceae bacterium]
MTDLRASIFIDQLQPQTSVRLALVGGQQMQTFPKKKNCEND